MVSATDQREESGGLDLTIFIQKRKGTLYLTNQRAHNCYDVRTLNFFPPAEC